MAKASVSLASFTPTEEEIAAARTLLRTADTKLKKSKTNSFTQFLTANKGCAKNAEMLGLKPGEDKTEAIAKYIAFQNAKKTGRLTHNRGNIEANTKFNDSIPMNKFKMTTEFGKETTDDWIASGKLTPEPDPITGSTADHMLIYQIPVAWRRTASGTEDRQDMVTEGALTDKGIQDFESMRADQEPSSGSGQKQVVKIEKSKEDIEKERKEAEAEKIGVFDNNKQNILMELNSAVMSLKLLEATAGTHIFTKPIGEAASKLRSKTVKLAKAMEDYVINATCLRDKGHVVLMSQVSVNEKEREDLNAWAAELGLVHAAPSGKRARKS